MGYCYIRSEPGLWTVGTYDSGEWEPESDHSSPEDAARRVSYLNGKPHDIIKCAHDLLADGSHPEYERGVIELVRDVLELADDDIRKGLRPTGRMA